MSVESASDDWAAPDGNEKWVCTGAAGSNP